MRSINKVISIVIFVCLITFFAFAINNLNDDYQQQDIARIEESLKNTAIECYSIEGFYPDNYQYLVDNYGIILDETKYHIFYESVSSNMMPTIKVYKRD